MERPAGGTDGAPRDLHLFGPLKKHVADKRYVMDTEGNTMSLPAQTLDSDISYARAQDSVPWWDACLHFSGA